MIKTEEKKIFIFFISIFIFKPKRTT